MPKVVGSLIVVLLTALRAALLVASELLRLLGVFFEKLRQSAMHLLQSFLLIGQISVELAAELLFICVHLVPQLTHGVVADRLCNGNDLCRRAVLAVVGEKLLIEFLHLGDISGEEIAELLHELLLGARHGHVREVLQDLADENQLTLSHCTTKEEKRSENVLTRK